MEMIIYKATHIESNKVYIGATTKSLQERKADHVQKANNNLGSYFQEAIGTYGPEAFVWEKIDTAMNNDELASKEVYYIQVYDSIKEGYNCDKGGGFKKTVYQYNLRTGELINTFPDLENAANAVNADKRSICNVCLRINKACKGFYWSYTNLFLPDLDKRKKLVNQYSLDGELLNTYNSASDASRNTTIPKVCINRCCRGERTQTGGFLWKYS